jgi:hypothetical protein
LSQTWSNSIILVLLISTESQEINDTKIIEFDQVWDKLWPYFVTQNCHPILKKAITCLKLDQIR